MDDFKQNYELTKLRNSRFPSFFFITMKNENKERSELISTNQHSWDKTLFTGEKPEEVSEFLHATMCLITVTNFKPQLTLDKRKSIGLDENEQVIVGILNVCNVGDFELVFDNKNQKIYLNAVE